MMTENIQDIAKEAEDIIKSLEKDKRGNIVLKTSQLRKFLTAVNTVTNKVDVWHMTHLKEKALSEELSAQIKYLKVKLAYQSGRSDIVKDFSNKSKLFERINCIGSDYQKYKRFSNLMEALVAYHKYYGGRDK